MTRGLVIGKFYPPHRGHHELIRFGRAQADHLDVVVCVRPDQAISGDLRQRWLREVHPDVNVIQVSDICDDENSLAWAEYTRSFLASVPNVVFTSESYGDAYSRLLGARHISFDPARRSAPISASAIRRDPLANWAYLEPCVRAHFAVRVCVVGAESTGTTTTAQKLAEHFGTAWVPEYGREYWVRRAQQEGPDFPWSTEDFLHIASEQHILEDRLARDCSGLLICDTDALATSVWHERYMGSRSQEVCALAAARRYPLYLLTDCDIPFIQDGTRDGEHKREWMTRRFLEELSSLDYNWRLLSGTIDERLSVAVREVEILLAKRPTSI